MKHKHIYSIQVYDKVVKFLHVVIPPISNEPMNGCENLSELQQYLHMQIHVKTLSFTVSVFISLRH